MTSVGRTPPRWLFAEGPFGVRWLDAGIVALVVGLNEIEVVVGGGPGTVPLNARAYLTGALLAAPVLFRHRWPVRVLFVAFFLVMLYYSSFRRDISPAPTLGVPVYDAALAGSLVWAIAIPFVVMSAGLLAVGLGGNETPVLLASNFLPSIAAFVIATRDCTWPPSRRNHKRTNYHHADITQISCEDPHRIVLSRPPCPSESESRCILAILWHRREADEV